MKRGMLMWQIKKICPSCITLPSDYELYNLFSHKMFTILRSFTPAVEEYSVDEAFADIKGLRRPLNMTYYEIGKAIKNKIESSLGITISIGISVTKSLAKLASSFQKPSGLTLVKGKDIEKILKTTPVKDVWGIGTNTSSYLNKLGIFTALDFALKSENFIIARLSKPFFEIWQELRGEKIYELDLQGKRSYKGITRSQTFTPSTNDKNILCAKVLSHIEDAFQQARKFHYLVGKVTPFLKTQNFEYYTKEVKLLKKTAYPYLIRNELKKAFVEIYQKGHLYRSTGCYISNLESDVTSDNQMELFEQNHIREEKVKRIYPLLEEKKVDFGSMLFDKQKIEHQKKKSKLKIPIMSLA
ncbi:DNA polymerase IV [Candidatus Roizmanbacteria bacterium]|nr:DNA polymerase IV [Candidatus Roizmanbacteria bacterium]